MDFPNPGPSGGAESFFDSGVARDRIRVPAFIRFKVLETA